MEIERRIEQLRAKYKLSSTHIFDETALGKWRIFSFRKNAKGFQASCAEGWGDDINSALDCLDDNLRIGPVKAAEKKELQFPPKPA